MFNTLKSLIKEKSEKHLSDIFTVERETSERKRCKNCLQSVKIDYVKCPHCRSPNFYKD